MKKRLLLLLAVLLMLGGCTQEDLDAIRASQSDLDNRVTALEEWQQSVNADILRLKTVVTSLEGNDYITAVSPLADGSGYSITFAKSGAVTIKNGTNGKDGADGTDGKDAVAPVISVKADTDGVYYWTLDGEWLTDAGGAKLRVTGKDGANGTDGTNGTNGTNGKDAVAPQVRINSESKEWEISTDGGNSWTGTGVTAEGTDGTNGTMVRMARTVQTATLG